MASRNKHFSPKQRETFNPSGQSTLGELDSRFLFLYIFGLTTIHIGRSLASLSLVPNPNILHPFASNDMVVNKDGDLELYAMYDTPKQLI